MSCAGIFGSGSTKTVVMEHHGMSGYKASPLHLYTLRLVTGPKYVDVISSIEEKWKTRFKDQKYKNSRRFIVKLGNDDPSQAVIPLFSSQKRKKPRVGVGQRLTTVDLCEKGASEADQRMRQ